VSGTLANWARHVFPERQILVRAEGRVSYITLSRRSQISMAALGTAAIALLAYALASPLYRPATPAEVVAAPAPVPLPLPVQLHVEVPAPNPELEARVAELQRQLDAANAKLAESSSRAESVSRDTIAASEAALAEAQARVRSLEEARDRALGEGQTLERQLAEAQAEANNHSDNLAQLNRTLEAKSGELRQSDAQRQALQARVHQLESDLDTANARTNQAKAELAANERKLQQLALEQEKTTQERNRLQSQLTEQQNRTTAPGAAVAAPSPAPQRTIADRPADQRSENTQTSGEIEQFLASTGIDVEKLVGSVGAVTPGQGGPFVALDTKRLGEVDARSEELQKIIRTLPLAAPLPHYTLESGFGGRADPFTHKPGFHPGLDMVAPYGSPIYSTAPGVVVFAGNKSEYGKVVEIDHGHGFATRYAHLHRVTVALGQRVSLHQQVGELGSTGRSTGPHLHYEVLVNGTAQDPEKFLQAGKNVVQASEN
jgi:murein DD-endopeptidase MepM/ murein hydrolase activator NlpD